ERVIAAQQRHDAEPPSAAPAPPADPVIPGERVTFTINVTNHGPSTAQFLTVTDPLTPLSGDLSAPLFVRARGAFTCSAAGGGAAAAGDPLTTPVSCGTDELAVGAT